ncbi:MAG TPA: hypothetical protein VMT20_20375 [Terriglobia bacterium]|nr:hypothetical protein [Terriglobia bacterium]
MGDALGKLIKFLDQLLPFLETAPVWLRYWIYALIILNFITIAVVSVSYLITKQKSAEAGTLEHFSLDDPGANTVIPLGETGRWMVAGKFPVIAADQDVKHDVQIEVRRLPGREKIPQNGSATISTAYGAWRFDSAEFPGEGSYEIVATAALGDGTGFRSVQVTCADKATAYRQSIVRDRERRSAPPIAWSKADPAELQRVKDQFAALQNQFYQQYMVANDLPQSLETVNLALNVLEPLIPAFPDDYDLQTFRAYMLKNYGMIMRDMGRATDADWSLDEAGKMFEAVHQQKPNDASVWNGLGTIAMLRGNPQVALQCIDQALFWQPGYPEALHDRELVLAALKAQQQPPGH